MCVHDLYDLTIMLFGGYRLQDQVYNVVDGATNVLQTITGTNEEKRMEEQREIIRRRRASNR